MRGWVRSDRVEMVKLGILRTIREDCKGATPAEVVVAAHLAAKELSLVGIPTGKTLTCP